MTRTHNKIKNRIKRFSTIFKEGLKQSILFPVSFYGGYRNKKYFKSLKAFCMFIGYPRSGHSLIGALLDAHPNIIVAHELDVLKYIYSHFNDIQIYYLLLNNSKREKRLGRKSRRFDYSVPNHYQGKFEKLNVIGDKKGWASTTRFLKNPSLFEQLNKTIKLDIKYIHVIRNPYDIITTMYLRRNKNFKTQRTFIDEYFILSSTINNLKKRINASNIFEFSHELFIEKPELLLKNLCEFLGEEASDDYLNDCAKIVYKTPNISRHKIQWKQEDIKYTECQIKKFTFLSGYTFDT